ncbi:MAG: FtsX-like permease family protein, partial [Candidatus Hodarchaeota archaeon]
VCSAYLVFFWTNFHMKTRREELRVLRSRGGNLKQVFGLIGAEFLGISIIGGIPGLVLGLFFTYFLVNRGQISLEFQVLLAFAIKLWNFALTWIIGLGVCVGLLLFASLWRVYKFVQIEMEIKREQEGTLQQFVSRHALDIGLLVAALIVLVIAIRDASIAAIAGSQLGVLFLVCMLATWIGVGHLLARSISKIGAYVSNSLMGKIRKQLLLIGKNFERRQKSTFGIAILLIITFSISVFVVVFISSAGSSAAVISNYETGSDFKIYTDQQNVSFAQTLEDDSGIEYCMPIQKGEGWLGFTTRVHLYGVNASIYPQIGYWNPNSFVSDTPEGVFARLNNVHHGIILNDFIAKQLEKDTNDRIILEVQSGGRNVRIEYLIVGVIYSAPGLGVLSERKGEIGFLEDYGGVIINGYAMLEVEYNITTADLFLAQATEPDNMAAKLETKNRLLGSPGVRHVGVSNIPPQDDILNLVGMNTILMLNLVGSLLVLVVVIIFFFGTVVHERKTEFAIMRACGASIKGVKRLVIYEELILLGFTLIEGYGLGAFFAWIFVNITFPTIYHPAPVAYVITIPFASIVILLIHSFSFRNWIFL